MPVTVFISSPLPSEHVETIRAVDPALLEVIYEPDLHPPRLRFYGDHKGLPFTRTAEQQERWRRHLGRAEVLWDFPPNDPDGGGGLAYAPRVKWIQGTSTGIGQRANALGLRDSPIICTTARGTHGGPVAEFAFLGILMHLRGLRHLEAEQRARRWTVYCADEVAGKTLGVVGAGDMAKKVLALGRAFGMRLLATARDYRPGRAAELGVEHYYPRGELHAMLRQVDALVLTLPHTPETEGFIDAAALAALKPGGVFVNIGRGQTVDELALIAALQAGRIGFAALDVTTIEPLPSDSPLWTLPNVLISPHSASAMPEENRRVTEIFCYNLRCYLDGRLEQMRNILDKKRMY